MSSNVAAVAVLAYWMEGGKGAVHVVLASNAVADVLGWGLICELWLRYTYSP